jgi:hypothetical protein
LLTLESVEELILALAAEDWNGLYEVIGTLDEHHPDVPQPVKVDAARQALAALMERGEIQLGWPEWPPLGPPTPVPDREARRLIAELRHWRPSERYLVLMARGGNV